jgi:transposase-like protein
LPISSDDPQGPEGFDWYLRFGLPYRDVEELLAERGVEVDHRGVT